MKRIVEIKRGDPVPNHAKWLKDVTRVTHYESKKEYYDDGMSCGYDTVEYPVSATFDVFEVTEYNQGEI